LSVINLGFEGYKHIMAADLAKARILSNALHDTGYFHIVSNIHQRKADVAPDDTDPSPQKYEYGLPVVSFRFSDSFKKDNPNLKQRWIQLQLRAIGWIVPK
jgi:glutamate decarboxylase